MPRGFQLFYDKPRSRRALTWLPEPGFLHAALDDGDDVDCWHEQTPILVGHGHFDAKRVNERFAGASAQMPPEIAGSVDTKPDSTPTMLRGQKRTAEHERPPPLRAALTRPRRAQTLKCGEEAASTAAIRESSR
jgi:hypothetical protein